MLAPRPSVGKGLNLAPRPSVGKGILARNSSDSATYRDGYKNIFSQPTYNNYSGNDPDVWGQDRLAVWFPRLTLHDAIDRTTASLWN